MLDIEPLNLRDKSYDKKIDDDVPSVTYPSVEVISVGDCGTEIKIQVSRIKKKNKFRQLRSSEEFETTIDAIFRGDKDLIRCLRSRQEKLAFLDMAIQRCDTDFVTAAVIHMKNTLRQRLFLQEIKSRPDGMDAYINYLRVTEQNELLFDFQSILGRPEAQIIKLKQALSIKSPIMRRNAINRCNTDHFASSVGPSRDLLIFWGGLISDESTLLEKQILLEEQDLKAQKQPETNARFKDIPRKCVLNVSVISTLFYSCLYHFDVSETLPSSPLAIKKTFDLSDKQFAWTALIALSMRKRWDLVDGLFQGKSWLGTKKVLKPVLDFDSVSRALVCYDAPIEVITKYASLIEDPEKKLEFGREYKISHLLLKK